MKLFYTYILFSRSKNRFYTGSTNDLNRRFEEHNSGHTKSTKSGIPWEFVFTKSFNNNSDARKFEMKIKKMKSRKFIEQLIESNENDIADLLKP
ncbi:MAG: GIY-YIG nuclease family protein [Chlorobi bacterium]|nr:GIY-YIG nuclease family protein [Chlorobiota bacterium]